MAKFEMDTDFIRRLAAILDETGLGEIELSDGERKIRVARPTTIAAPVPTPIAVTPMGSAAAPVAVVPVTADHSKHPGAVKSPMVGTTYLSPEPGKPVFVNLGDKVNVGQTLLIIEAMKTFNPIKAAKAGTVTQILIEDKQPVEFGQALMIVE